MFTRRHAMAASAVAIAMPSFAELLERKTMYGLIGEMKVVPGKRAELIHILADGTRNMPGCLSYVIAEDKTDGDSIWANSHCET